MYTKSTNIVFDLSFILRLKASFHLGKLSSGQKRIGKFPLC